MTGTARTSALPRENIPLLIFVVAGTAGVLASLILMAARVYGAISFAEPLQGMTRGVEYEMMYSIWQYAEGWSVYTDPNRIPFTASYYNWLHYAAYGEVVKAVQALTSVDDAWLPTITRLTTLAGCFAGTWTTYRAAVDLLDIQRRLLRWFAGLFAAFLFLGPLLGFWAIATGPDIWPMVFVVVAIHGFSRCYPHNRVAAVLIAAVLGYAAWAFKQNFLYIPGTVGLFLLLRRDWMAAVGFSVLLVGAAALTFWVGGPEYTRSLLFRGTATGLSGAVFLHNAANAAVKFLPILLAFIAGLVAVAVSHQARRAVIDPVRSRPVLMIPYIGLLISLLEALPTSAIVNASENHYFVPAVFLTLATLQMIVHLSGAYRCTWVIAAAGVLGWALNILAVGAVLAGFQGIVSVRPFHAGLMAQAKCLQGIAEPFYVFNSYLALPWIVPSDQPFVVHFDYWQDVADGIAKEAGGVPGLVHDGYFATVVLPEERRGGPLADLDLDRYRPRPDVCQGMVIYDRVPG